MDSKELGLVIPQQLLGLQDLHYGFWDEGRKPEIADFVNAQKRYSEFIIASIRDSVDNTSAKILDVGCGTGAMISELIKLGYQVDGVIPSAFFKEKIEQRLRDIDSTNKSIIYNCMFEDFPESERRNQYDLIFFSESFQYISMIKGFPVLQSLLKEKGKILICDFFKTVHHGDGGPGDKSMGGGHRLNEFYDMIKGSYKILKDEDITGNVSPNLELMNDILMNRISPTIKYVDLFLVKRYRIIYTFLKFCFRKRIKKLDYKYFSGYRSKETFERYKTYHLIILENQK
ncbi:MAG: class I SAM-dependent methyltransferase [Bacteroidales bacterium]|nr:MAG: class I SAM-dependent methyltransferase [Bacteroidales bacterium]